MPPLIRRLVRQLKLIYLWITRILFARNRFRVPLPIRLWYAVFGGFVGDQYVLYNLRSRNTGQYLSEFDWYRSRWINEPFDPMLNNKIVCNETLAPHTRVPQIYYIRNRGRLVSYHAPESHNEVDDVLRFLRIRGAAFLKPIGSGKGKGVHRIDAVRSGWLVDARPVPESKVRDLLSSMDGWFLSEAMEQHPEVAAIFPETTNTARIITLRDPETGIPEVFFAVLRIGAASTIPVDNGSRGGLVARIDLNTGALSEARSLWSTESHTHHPDSGNPIKGTILPGWSKTRDAVVDLTHKFPYLQIIAWDILLTDSGFCVIEANTSTGVNIIQIWGGQRNGTLGNFFRAHGVIT